MKQLNPTRDGWHRTQITERREHLLWRSSHSTRAFKCPLEINACMHPQVCAYKPAYLERPVRTMPMIWSCDLRRDQRCFRGCSEVGELPLVAGGAAEPPLVIVSASRPCCEIRRWLVFASLRENCVSSCRSLLRRRSPGKAVGQMVFK